MPFTMKKDLQNTTRNNSVALIEIKNGFPDTISNWIKAYFRLEVTTSESSQKVQLRDLTLFRDFLLAEAGSDERRFWIPRLSKAFKDRLKKKDYIERERKQDHKRWKSPALFLSAATTAHGNGRLNPKVINTVWNEVCQLAEVEGQTPHDARHAMGKHLIEKTGSLAAVQRQLGHTNATYSMQYTRITDEELGNALEDR